MTHPSPDHIPLPSPLTGALRGGRALWLASLLALLLVCRPAMALPPQRMLLDAPVLTVPDGVVTLALGLTVDNEDGLRDMLKDGSVLELTVGVTFDRERSFWSNAEAVSKEFVSTLRHDPLSRDFIVTMPGGDEQRQLRDRNLTRLLHASWRKLLLPIAPVVQIYREEPAKSYAVTVTVSLHHTEVPPWLEKSTMFWSSEVVPKEKRSLTFLLPHGL